MQTMMFSATMLPELQPLMQQYPFPLLLFLFFFFFFLMMNIYAPGSVEINLNVNMRPATTGTSNTPLLFIASNSKFSSALSLRSVKS